MPYMKMSIPEIRKSDRHVVDRYYWVEAPWFVNGEFVKARYVGEYCDGDGPSSPWFKVDGHDCLFAVGNPYMVRSDLETLRKTFLVWAENELYDITDPDRLEAQREGIRLRIRRLMECDGSGAIRG